MPEEYIREYTSSLPEKMKICTKLPNVLHLQACNGNKTMNELTKQDFQLVLFDTEESHENLLPLAYTRPVAAFRIGIDTIAEKWCAFLGCASCSFLTAQYLREKYPMNCAPDEEALFVAGNILPDASLADAVLNLAPGHALAHEGRIWAYRGTPLNFESAKIDDVKEMAVNGRRIEYVFDIFLKNGMAIKEDYARIAPAAKGIAPDPSTRIIGNMFLPDGTPALTIEEGATVEGAIINLTEGPVYIGRNATVMEGACLRGPLAICDNAKIKMGAKIYEGSTFGPYCKVGGEVSNAVMFGYSNKAHDGYLGNAVIGEWCNLGAGTNSSNLKNDYSKIRIWNYAKKTFMRTDLQFCGLIMGDHSKAGINCMFNTATVVGVGVNIHGCGYARVFIPSFQNGSPEAGMSDTSIDTFMTVAGRVMSRRGLVLDDVDRRIFESIYTKASGFKGR